VEESSAVRRGSLQRKLTMKYDMHALNTLQKYEDDLAPELAALYNLSSPDDLTVELDLMAVFNAPPELRVEMLVRRRFAHFHGVCMVVVVSV
jgi:hypothetical protein